MGYKQLTHTIWKGMYLSPCSAECKAHVALVGELEERNGYKFPTFKTLKIDFTVGKGSVQLKNLFGGDKLLGKYLYQAAGVLYTTDVIQQGPHKDISNHSNSNQICGGKPKVFNTANTKACHWTKPEPFPSMSHPHNMFPYTLSFSPASKGFPHQTLVSISHTLHYSDLPLLEIWCSDVAKNRTAFALTASC